MRRSHAESRPAVAAALALLLLAACGKDAQPPRTDAGPSAGSGPAPDPKGIVPTRRAIAGTGAAALMSGTVNLNNETQQLHLIVLPEIDWTVPLTCWPELVGSPPAALVGAAAGGGTFGVAPATAGAWVGAVCAAGEAQPATRSCVSDW